MIRTRMSLRHLTATTVAMAAVLFALVENTGAATPSPSSTIVYACGSDLCAVDPASGESGPITSDHAGYGSPSVSLDGRRIAATRGTAVLAGAYGSNLPEGWGTAQGINDVAISPDGTAIAYSYWYSELKYVYRYTCGGACLEVQYFSGARYQTSPSGPPMAAPGSSGVGFLGGSALLSREITLGNYDTATGTFPGSTVSLCLIALPPGDSPPCTNRIVEPYEAGGRQRNISDPAASPDGRWIAAVVGLVPIADGAIVDNPTGENPTVVLYDGATGGRVREVAAGATKPTFSPDGSQIAYESTDGWIYVAPTAGGSPRRLAQGTQPTWGSSGGGAAVATQKARYRAGRVALKVSCAATTTCAGKIALKQGKKTLGGGKFSVKAGKTAMVKVKSSRRGRQVFERKRPQRVTATLIPKQGADLTATVRVGR